MPRPRRDANTVPTVQRILAAAEQAFAAQSYERARLSDIARAAGITRPSLLYHFKTKEALYAAVVSVNITALSEAFDAARSTDGEHDEQLLALVQTYVDFLESRPSFSSLMLRELLNEQGVMRETFRDLLVPILDNVEQWVVASGRAAPGIPVRSALLHLAVSALVRTAVGDLRASFWREGSGTLALTRHLLLSDPADRA